MEMSFLGYIGHLMDESGLQEILEVAYAGNAVKHMRSGKAISRAVRGNLLVDAAINTILVSNAYNLPLPTYQPYQPQGDIERPSEDCHMISLSDEMEMEVNSGDGVSDSPEQDLLEDGQILDHLFMDPETTADLSSSEVLSRVGKKLEEERESVNDLRTAQLWVQYLDTVAILKKFIKAERTGNWKLQIKFIYKLQPLSQLI